MRRLWHLVPVAMLLSCGPADRPTGMGVSIRIPQIVLSRLDPDLHLRIFEKGDRTCAIGSGVIQRGGMPVFDFAGQDVRPHQRCDSTFWGMHQSEFGGTATPVDVCFQAGATRQVMVPGGQYLVLVEGSGIAGDGSGAHVTLGSGCFDLGMVMNGETRQVQIEMHEQAARGRCGDGQLDADELCDAPGDTSNCNAQCRFPERVANSANSTGRKKHPSVAWTSGQNLVVGFDASGNENVMVHIFNQEGMPITDQAALANDHNIDANAQSVQDNVRLYATPTGYAAAWSTIEATFMDFDVQGAFFNGYGNPGAPALPPDVTVNPTSSMAGQNRTTPAVAASDSRVVFLFADSQTQSIRVSSTALGAGPIAAPTADSAVAPAAMNTNAVDPAIVAISGGFVATWSAGAAGNREIYAVRLSAMGAPMGAPVLVNTQLANDQDQPAIAAVGNDVIIAWRDASSTESDTSGTTIRWRRFDPSLTPSGNDRIAVTTPEGNQVRPTVAMGGNNAVLIAWEHSDATIRGIFLHPDGSGIVSRIGRSNGDFTISAAANETPTFTGARHNPSAGFGGAGRFVVAWEAEEAGSFEIHMRVLRD